MEKTSNKEIRFTSTRDSKVRLDFWQSIIQGISHEGGLLVPTQFPTLSVKKLKDTSWWKNSKPHDFTYEALRLFIPQNVIGDEELFKMAKHAINFKIPLDKVGQDYVLRIDQGPTASFKDVAARTIATLMEKYAAVHEKKINIVVATSGDTGVAIADAFGNSKNVTVTVLYPNGGVSEIQEKQMLEVHHKYKNEQVIPINGNFDDCQDIAKKLLLSGLNLSSANSINIWRLIPQMTQYFVAYKHMIDMGKIKVGEKIVVSVPTGNVGHLMAGIYAREIGLPIKKFIIGTNTNNILANIIGDGVIRHRPFRQSSAPSMDILDPSNLERLLHFSAYKTNTHSPIGYLSMKKDIKDASHIHNSIPLSKYGVTEKMLDYIRELIWAEDVETDEEIHAMMRQVYADSGVVMEPHGITGYIASIRSRAKGVIEEKQSVIIFETAHPDKFKTSLDASDLNNVNGNKHSVLERLKKTPMKKFVVPKALGVDLNGVAKRIKNLTIGGVK